MTPVADSRRPTPRRFNPWRWLYRAVVMAPWVGVSGGAFALGRWCARDEVVLYVTAMTAGLVLSVVVLIFVIALYIDGDMAAWWYELRRRAEVDRDKC